MKHRWTRFAILLGILMVSPHAWADAIPMPSACPLGTYGESSHSGTSCVLAGCETDESCERTPGTTCQEWRVCTFEREVTVYSHRRGGRMDSGLGTEPATVERTFVVGTCDPSEACMGLEEPAPPSLYLRGDEEISCAEQQLCVPEMLPPLPRIAPEEAADDASESDRSDDSRSRGARKQGKGCGCSPGPTQALPLALAGLIGGLALLGRRYP